MDNHLVDTIYKDLGLDKSKISVSTLAANLRSNPIFAQTIYGNTSLADMGIDYDQFRNVLGIDLPQDDPDTSGFKIFAYDNVPRTLDPILGDPNSLNQLYANGVRDPTLASNTNEIKVYKKKGNFYNVVFPDGTKNVFLDTDNANFWEEGKHLLANTFFGTLSKGALDVVGMGYGAAKDIFEYVVSPADSKGWDNLFNNSVREFAESFERNLSVEAINSQDYQKLLHEAEGATNFFEGAFAFLKKLGHAEFWYTEGGDGIESMLGFMIPGLAIGKAVSNTARVAKVARELKVSREVAGNLVKLGVADTYMSAIEAGMEAKETMKMAEEKFLRDGLDPDEARRRAAKYASETFGLNFLTLMASNFIELSAISGPFTKTFKQGLFDFSKAALAESAQEIAQFGIQEEAGRFEEEEYDPDEVGFLNNLGKGIRKTLERSWEGLSHGNPEAISSAGLGFMLGGSAATFAGLKKGMDWRRKGKKIAGDIDAHLIKTAEDLYEKKEDGSFREVDGRRVIDRERLAKHYKAIEGFIATDNAIKNFSNIGEHDAARALYSHQIAQAVYNGKKDGLSDEQVSSILDSVMDKTSYEALGNSDMTYEQFKEEKKEAVKNALDVLYDVSTDPSLKENSNLYKQKLYFNTVQQNTVSRMIESLNSEISSLEFQDTTRSKDKIKTLKSRVAKLEKAKEFLNKEYTENTNTKKEDVKEKKKNDVKKKVVKKINEGKNPEQITNELKDEGVKLDEVEDDIIEKTRREQLLLERELVRTEEDLENLRSRYSDVKDVNKIIDEHKAAMLKKQQLPAPKNLKELRERYGEANNLLAEIEEREIDDYIRANVPSVNLEEFEEVSFNDKLNDDNYGFGALEYFNNRGTKDFNNTDIDLSKNPPFSTFSGQQLELDLKDKTETPESSEKKPPSEEPPSKKPPSKKPPKPPSKKPSSKKPSKAPSKKTPKRWVVAGKLIDKIFRGATWGGVPADFITIHFKDEDGRTIDVRSMPRTGTHWDGMDYEEALTKKDSLKLVVNAANRYNSREEKIIYKKVYTAQLIAPSRRGTFDPYFYTRTEKEAKEGVDAFKLLAEPTNRTVGQEKDGSKVYYETDSGLSYYSKVPSTADNIIVQIVMYVSKDGKKVVDRDTEGALRRVIGYVETKDNEKKKRDKEGKAAPDAWNHARPIREYLAQIFNSEGVTKGPSTTISQITTNSQLDLVFSKEDYTKRDIKAEELADLTLSVVVSDANVARENTEDYRFKDSSFPEPEGGFKMKDLGSVWTKVKNTIVPFSTKQLKEVPELIDKLREYLTEIESAQGSSEVRKEVWKNIIGIGTDQGIVTYRTSLSDVDTKGPEGQLFHEEGRGPVLWYDPEKGYTLSIKGKDGQSDYLKYGLSQDEVIKELSERRVHVTSNPEILNSYDYKVNFLSKVLKTNLAENDPAVVGENSRHVFAHSPSSFVLNPIDLPSDASNSSKVMHQENKVKSKRTKTDSKTNLAKKRQERNKKLRDKPRLKRSNDEAYGIGKEKALSYLRERLEELDINVDQATINKLYDMFERGGTQKIWGAFWKGTVILAEGAGKKVAKHEAFHAVFNLFLTDNQRKEILTEAFGKWGEDLGISEQEFSLALSGEELEESKKEDPLILLEERLADEFENYQDSKELFDADGSFSKSFPKIAKFFNSLYKFLYNKGRILKGYFSNEYDIGRLFYEIENNILGRDLLGNRRKSFRQIYKRNLENVLNKEPLFKIRDWTTGETIRYAESVVRDAFSWYLEMNHDVERVSELSSDRKIQEVVNTWYNNLPYYFEQYLKDNYLDNYPRNQEILEVLAQENSETEDFKQVILRSFLTIRGMKVTNISEEIEKGEEVISEENELERWQLQVKLTNPQEKVSRKLREFLSSIPVYLFKGTPLEIDADWWEDTGQQKYHSITSIHNFLLDRLSDSLDPKDMYNKLIQIRSEGYDWAHTLLERIMIDGNIQENEDWSYKIAQESAIFRNMWMAVGSMRNTEFITLSRKANGEWVTFVSNRRNLRDKIRETARYVFDLKYWDVEKEELKLSKERYNPKLKTVTDLDKYLKFLGFTVPRYAVEAMMSEVFDIQIYAKKLYDSTIAKGEHPFSSYSTSHDNPLNNIVQLIQKYDVYLDQRVFTNVEGEKQYNHLPNNYISRVFNMLTSHPDVFAQTRKNYIFHNDLPFYNDLFDARGNVRTWVKHMKIQYLDGHKPRGLRSGKPYKKFNEIDVSTGNINAYYSSINTNFAGVGRGTMSRFANPVFGDKDSQVFAMLPLLNKIDNSLRSVTDIAIDKLLHVGIAEFNRQQAYKNSPQYIENYGSEEGPNRALKFNFIPAFNSGYVTVALEDGTHTGLNSANRRTLERHLEREFKDYLNKLEQAGAIYFNENAGQYVANPDTGLLDKGITQKILKEYFYQQYYYNIVLTSLTSLDPAFYKGVGDFQKRNSQTHSPGDRLFWRKGQNFSMLILKDIKRNSSDAFKAAMGKLFGEGPTRYDTGNNLTDGQGLHTLKRRKDILIAQDKWTDEHRDAWEALENGTANDRQLSIVLQPLKPFYYGEYGVTKKGTNTKLLLPLQIKNSEAVLLPQVAYELIAPEDAEYSTKRKKAKRPSRKNPDFSVYKYPELARLLYFMEGNGDPKNNGTVDLVVFDSAVKVGKHNVVDVNEDSSLLQGENIYSNVLKNVPYKNFSIQNNVPAKHINSEVVLSTQSRKNIFSNIKNIVIGTKKYLIRAIKDHYDESLILDINETLKELHAKIKDINKLKKMLQEHAIDQGFDQHVIDGLEIDENGNFVIPLEMPLMGKLFQKFLNAQYKKVIRAKHPGASLVNHHSWSFSNDLRYEFNEDGSIKHVEAMVPIYNDKLYDVARRLQADIEQTVLLPDGTIDAEILGKHHPELVKGFFYRIPTEGKHSMFPIKIKRFIPNVGGGHVILPIQATTISGFDFDIDKLYGNWPALDEEGNYIPPSLDNYASRANLRLAYSLAAASTVEFAKAHFNPGTIDELEQLVTDAKFSLESIDENIASPNVQEALAGRNMTGARIIGIVANSNAHHNMIEGRAELRLKRPLYVDGNQYQSFSKREKDYQEDLETRSRSLGMILLASVDHGKTPVLNSLGINEVTISYATTMIRLGVPLIDIIKELRGNPIYQRITKMVYENNIRREDAVKVILEEMPDSKAPMLEKEPYLNLLILEAAASQMFRVEQAAKADAGSVGPSLFNVYEKLVQIEEVYEDTKKKSWVIEGAENVIPRIRIRETTRSHKFEDGNTIEYPAVVAEFAEKSPVKMIDAYTNVLVEEFNQLAQHYNFFTSIPYNIIKDILKFTNERHLSADQIEIIIHDMYLSQLQNALPVNLQELYNEFPKKFFGSELPEQYAELKKIFTTVQQGPGRLLRFFNSVGYLPEDLERLRNTWEQLFRDNPELATNLALYSILINGFQFRVGTFNQLIPGYFFTDTEIGREIKRLVKAIGNNEYHFNTQEQVLKTIENNYARLTPRITLEESEILEKDSNGVPVLIDIKLKNKENEQYPYVHSFIYNSALEKGYYYLYKLNKVGQYSLLKSSENYDGVNVYNQESLTYETSDMDFKLKGIPRVGNTAPIGQIQENDPYNMDAGTKKPTDKRDPLYGQFEEDDGNFFNLSDYDNKRKRLDGRVNKLMQRYIAKLGLKVMSMENYKEFYQERYGKTIDALGFADMFKGIIAVAEGADGVTLPEEVWHFIVELTWDRPEMQAIRNAKTAEGTNALESSELWLKEGPKYFRVYKGDKTKVQKEVIAKYLARYTHDQLKSERIDQKLINWIKKLLSRFFKSISNNPEVSSVGLSEDLDRLLKQQVRDLIDEKIPVERFETLEGQPDLSEFSWKEETIRSAVKNLKVRLAKIFQEQVGLVSAEMKERFAQLESKFGKKQIKQLLDDLEEIRRSNAPESIHTREALEEYIDLLRQVEADEKNLEKIERLSKRLEVVNENLRKRKFEGGIHMFFFGSGELPGAFQDLYDITRDLKRVQSGELKMDYQMYHSMTESVELYEPLVRSIFDFYKSGGAFSELGGRENKKFSGRIDGAILQLQNIKSILKTNTTELFIDELNEAARDNPQLAKVVRMGEYILHDSGDLNLRLGTPSDNKERIMGIFMKKIMDLSGYVNRNTHYKGTVIYNKIGESLEKIGLGGLKRLQERDENGDKTGYFISPWKTYLYEKRRREQSDKIIDELNEYSDEKGWNLHIPKDRDFRHAFFKGEYLIGLPEDQMDEQEKRIASLKKLYDTKWAQWFIRNLKTRSDYKEIIKRREKEMSKTHFRKWLSDNVIVGETVNTITGEPIKYKIYTGELSVPTRGETVIDIFGKEIKSFDYSNPEYKNLSEDELKVLNELHTQVKQSKRRIGVTPTFEVLMRLPQITRSTSDMLWARGKGLGDKIADSVVARDDDELRANKINGQIIERPPIRFTKLIATPGEEGAAKMLNNLTDDLFSSTMKYVEMAEKFSVFSKALPELQGMRDAVAHSQVYKNKSPMGVFSRKKEERETIDGVNSNLHKRMTHMMKTLIFGESMASSERELIELPNGTKIDPIKVSNTFAGYIRDLNLLGNIPSYITGLLLGTADRYVESHVIRKYLDVRDVRRAKVEFYRSIPAILKDFETPVKTNKISVAMRSLGIVDSATEVFASTNKNRLWRMVGQTLRFGGWRAMDIALKGQAMIATAEGIRLIDNNWYTKSMFEASPHAENKEMWENATTLWSQIKVKDGQMVLSDLVTKKAMLEWQRRSIYIGARLDTVYTEYDKGTFYAHMWFRFLTLHMSWLYQQTGRAFKEGHYNEITGEYEEGYFRSVWNTGLLNPLRLLNIFNDWETFSAVEKENLKRVLSMIGVFAFVYAVATVLTAIANDDDDDNIFIQHLAYLASRLVLEQSARLSAYEAFEYAKRPLGGLDKFNNFGIPFEIALNIFGNEEEIKSGLYKGHDKVFRDSVKAIPLVKGLFENLYGGWYNEITGTGDTFTVGTGVRGKRNYVNNRVLNTSSGKLVDWPILPIVRYLSSLTARPLAYYMAPDQYMSESRQDLPTKKANK